MGWRLFLALPAPGLVWLPRRLLLFCLLWLLFGILNLLHWLGFLLDELLFWGYRRVKIEAPLFILGVPRSGTTYLQRLLADDSGFTSLTTFECVLAPSVSERWFWLGITRLFGWLWSLLQRLLPGRLAGRGKPGAPGILARMDAVHPIRLGEPEEDFLLLLQVQACFLAVLLCPNENAFWHLARFDTEIPAGRRKRIMCFYRRCLQKHIYFHGGRRLLSKNPSFTSMLQTLRSEFPDGCFLACVRQPEEAVPSQLSSLRPAFELFGEGRTDAGFNERLLAVLHDYYAGIARFAAEDRLFVIDMQRLNSDLEALLQELFDFAGHEPDAGFAERIPELGKKGRQYRSHHTYVAEDFGLTESEISRRFRDVWQNLGALG